MAVVGPVRLESSRTGGAPAEVVAARAPVSADQAQDTPGAGARKAIDDHVLVASDDKVSDEGANLLDR